MGGHHLHVLLNAREPAALHPLQEVPHLRGTESTELRCAGCVQVVAAVMTKAVPAVVLEMRPDASIDDHMRPRALLRTCDAKAVLQSRSTSQPDTLTLGSYDNMQRMPRGSHVVRVDMAS